MNKHIAGLVLICITCLLISGCSEQNSAPENSRNESNGAEAVQNSVDIDLTALSSTVAYAEVYNIMSNPNDYMGKSIKIKGPYDSTYYEPTESYYHFVIIEDVSACCQAGVEFIWKGEHNYPDDYPEEQANIEISGIFGSYEELGQIYYYLSVDDITIL